MRPLRSTPNSLDSAHSDVGSSCFFDASSISYFSLSLRSEDLRPPRLCYLRDCGPLRPLAQSVLLPLTDADAYRGFCRWVLQADNFSWKRRSPIWRALSPMKRQDSKGCGPWSPHHQATLCPKHKNVTVSGNCMFSNGRDSSARGRPHLGNQQE